MIALVRLFVRAVLLNFIPVLISAYRQLSEHFPVISFRDGRISVINWPKPILQIDYDRYNRTSWIFNAFLNEKVHYKYDAAGQHNKIAEIRRGRNAVYRLIYDHDNKLRSVITPNSIPVQFTQLVSLGFRRILYQPYGVSSNFIYDFETLHGNLFRLIYPSRDYQINLFYSTNDNQLSDVIYGPERISWLRNSTTSLISSIEKRDLSKRFHLRQIIVYDGPFLTTINSMISLHSPNNSVVLYNNLVMYNYDNEMQLTKIHLILHDPSRTLRDLRLESSLIYNTLHRRVQWDEFKFHFNPIEKIKLPLENGYILTKYNVNGRLQSRIIQLNDKHISLDVFYNENNKNSLLISSFKIKRSNTNDEFDTKLSYYLESEMVTNVHNVDYIEYKYYEDGRLKSMRINTGAPIEYIYDHNTGLLRKCGLVSYLYNDDGFLTQKLTGLHHEKFGYNAFGLLKEYTKEFNKKITVKVEYFYDGMHRLILQRDCLNTTMMIQYFYTDPANPNRLTHMLDSQTKQLSSYYYDSTSGHLFSIRVDKTFYYVLADFIGSPRVILSQNFDVVWERDYDIFGEYKSIREWNVVVPIGFGGSLSDRNSRLLFINNRVYDPNGKSFSAFHWSALFTHINNIKLNPLAINSYQFHYFPCTFERHIKIDFSNFLKPDYWMKKFGIDMDSLLSEKHVALFHDAVSLPKEFLMKFAYDHFEISSVHDIMAKHSANNFHEFQYLQTSDLLPPDVLPYQLTQAPEIPMYLFSFSSSISISIVDHGQINVEITVGQLSSLFVALFRNTSLLNIHSSRKDIVWIFLLKQSCSQLRMDLQQLGMINKSQHAFGHNLNLSVINHDNKLTEVILQQRYFVISVRYCTTLIDQMARITSDIRSETNKLFWSNRRRQLYRHELIQDQIIIDSKEELLKYGYLRGTVFDSWHNVTAFPLIVDDLSTYKVRKVKSLP